jgi:hypothetical protein
LASIALVGLLGSRSSLLLGASGWNSHSRIFAVV